MTASDFIPFNRATFSKTDLKYLTQAMSQGHSAGNGPFTERSERILSEMHLGSRCLLTTSCTHALEMAARLIDLKHGDEVIVPSYTFVSSASAFVWNGARPVFADVRPDTLNMDPDQVEELITDRTRAICLVHYAGVGAQPDRFVKIANEYGLTLIEDNAHGLGGSYDGRPLGTFGSLSTLSFHETKNITCGEGGALIINDPKFVERAEILREKGTDRTRFLRGQVDKYTWVDTGSSWVLSDLLAAILLGQLERIDEIQQARMKIWEHYARSLEPWAQENGVRLPTCPMSVHHPAHLFYLRFGNLQHRDEFIQQMNRSNVTTVFHYQALHMSPQGLALDPSGRQLPNSRDASETIVRLPLYTGLSRADQNHVIAEAMRFSPLR